jgi:hypothetical protein
MRQETDPENSYDDMEREEGQDEIRKLPQSTKS